MISDLLFNKFLSGSSNISSFSVRHRLQRFEELCLTEKLEILDDPDKNLLNKRSEIISQCRHKNKYRLKTLASSMTSDGIT